MSSDPRLRRGGVGSAAPGVPLGPVASPAPLSRDSPPAPVTLFSPAEADGGFAVPLASAAVAAGFPSPADDYVEARIDLNQALIPRPLSTFFMRVSGDAMAADGILDGDLLVIDRSVAARPGLVVVATHAGTFIVRRLQGPQRGRGQVLLVASDGLSPPIPLADGEAEIWGVVIHAVHHLTASR
jgi:DNA polymerase V